MVYITHARGRTGVHRIPDEWLEGFRPSGFRLATAAEVTAWHAERGLDPPEATGVYCPSCLRQVPVGAAERHVHREACASGPLLVWLSSCPACGTVLAAEVVAEADEAAAAP